MKIERRDREQETELRLSGDDGIQHAAELRASLMQAFERGMTLRIDASGVTDAQFPLFQTLCSAHRTSILGDVPIVLAPNWSAAMRSAAEAVGLPHSIGCPSCGRPTCLWVGEQR